MRAASIILAAAAALISGVVPVKAQASDPPATRGLYSKDGKLIGQGKHATIWKKSDGPWKATFDLDSESPLEAK